jgi:NAD+ synthase
MMQTDLVVQHINDWLTNYLTKSGMNGFVVGISGGIDSAVTSTLCAKTGLRTLCVEMPIYQAPDQVSRAQKHVKILKEKFANVSAVEVDLTKTFETFKSSVPQAVSNKNEEISLANTRARLRMTTLYYFAALHGYLVAGTGNKVEDFGVGFYTKYGDGGVDLSPIADLMKTEVFKLGKELGVIEDILQAEPTDGLWEDNRSDVEQMGSTYEDLEWAMAFEENGGDESSLTKDQQKALATYRKFNKANQHKMQPIPVCEIPKMLKK